MPDLVIRPAVQDDFEILWDFLAMAAYEPDAEAAKAVPSVAKYLAGWRRPGDASPIAKIVRARFLSVPAPSPGPTGSFVLCRIACPPPAPRA